MFAAGVRAEEVAFRNGGPSNVFGPCVVVDSCLKLHTPEPCKALAHIWA